MITVVSLGTERGELTLKGLKVLQGADKVFVRTALSPAVSTLDDEGIPYTSFDALYEKCRNYDTLARRIAAEVRKAAKEGNVCYCVDGGVFEDAAARLLLKRAAYVEGPTKAARLAALAGIAGGYTALSAFDVKETALALPLVIYDLTADSVGDIKLFLAEKFGDEAPACLISGGHVRKIALYEADRAKTYDEAGLVVFDEPLLQKKRFGFDDLVAILRRLRAPDGCPWDRVQTHESIRINAIEEAYELVDAIDRDDPERMCEEAGDVLMQAVFHALMEEERGSFSVDDMLTGLCEKLITRHTHVFGKDRADSAEGALSVWDKNKMKEKHQETFSDAVNDVPACFPALLRAQKIAKRMEKGGWDPATVENFERKFREEYGELMDAFRAGDGAHVSEELGDVLFCAVELGRAVGADCEQALLDTVKKMQARYTAYEGFVLADGKDVRSLSEEEKNAYYERAKHVG